MPTDTEMLNWLEAQNAKARYTGRCTFRWSYTGRGWRLHEIENDGIYDTYPSVREAIAAAMQDAQYVAE